MPRPFDLPKFGAAFERYIVNGEFNETPEYYPRYRSRYERLMWHFSTLVPEEKIEAAIKFVEASGGEVNPESGEDSVRLVAHGNN